MATVDQIKAEAQALKDAPVIIPVVGMVERCHICGSVMHAEHGKVFDRHIASRIVRKACGKCNAG